MFKADKYVRCIEPLLPPDLSVYGVDWKLYYEHYQIYARYVKANPCSGPNPAKCSPEKEQETIKPLDRSVDKNHSYIEQKDVFAPGKPQRPEKLSIPNKTYSEIVVSAKQVSPTDTLCSQFSVDAVATPPTRVPTPVQRPQPVHTVKGDAKEQALPGRVRNNRDKYGELKKLYADKASGTLHRAEEVPTVADSVIYLSNSLSKSVIEDLIRNSRLPKTYEALNNLAEQCERRRRKHKIVGTLDSLPSLSN